MMIYSMDITINNIDNKWYLIVTSNSQSAALPILSSDKGYVINLHGGVEIRTSDDFKSEVKKNERLKNLMTEVVVLSQQSTHFADLHDIKNRFSDYVEDDDEIEFVEEEVESLESAESLESLESVESLEILESVEEYEISTLPQGTEIAKVEEEAEIVEEGEDEDEIVEEDEIDLSTLPQATEIAKVEVIRKLVIDYSQLRTLIDDSFILDPFIRNVTQTLFESIDNNARHRVKNIGEKFLTRTGLPPWIIPVVSMENTNNNNKRIDGDYPYPYSTVGNNNLYVLDPPHPIVNVNHRMATECATYAPGRWMKARRDHSIRAIKANTKTLVQLSGNTYQIVPVLAPGYAQKVTSASTYRAKLSMFLRAMLKPKAVTLAFQSIGTTLSASVVGFIFLPPGTRSNRILTPKELNTVVKCPKNMDLKQLITNHYPSAQNVMQTYNQSWMFNKHEIDKLLHFFGYDHQDLTVEDFRIAKEIIETNSQKRFRWPKQTKHTVVNNNLIAPWFMTDAGRYYYLQFLRNYVDNITVELADYQIPSRPIVKESQIETHEYRNYHEGFYYTDQDIKEIRRYSVLQLLHDRWNSRPDLNQLEKQVKVAYLTLKSLEDHHDLLMRNATESMVRNLVKDRAFRSEIFDRLNNSQGQIFLIELEGYEKRGMVELDQRLQAYIETSSQAYICCRHVVDELRSQDLQDLTDREGKCKFCLIPLEREEKEDVQSYTTHSFALLDEESEADPMFNTRNLLSIALNKITEHINLPLIMDEQRSIIRLTLETVGELDSVALNPYGNEVEEGYNKLRDMVLDDPNKPIMSTKKDGKHVISKQIKPLIQQTLHKGVSVDNLQWLAELASQKPTRSIVYNVTLLNYHAVTLGVMMAKFTNHLENKTGKNSERVLFDKVKSKLLYDILNKYHETMRNQYIYMANEMETMGVAERLVGEEYCRKISKLFHGHYSEKITKLLTKNTFFQQYTNYYTQYRQDPPTEELNMEDITVYSHPLRRLSNVPSKPFWSTDTWENFWQCFLTSEYQATYYLEWLQEIYRRTSGVENLEYWPLDIYCRKRDREDQVDLDRRITIESFLHNQRSIQSHSKGVSLGELAFYADLLPIKVEILEDSKPDETESSPGQIRQRYRDNQKQLEIHMSGLPKFTSTESEPCSYTIGKISRNVGLNIDVLRYSGKNIVIDDNVTLNPVSQLRDKSVKIKTDETIAKKLEQIMYFREHSEGLNMAPLDEFCSFFCNYINTRQTKTINGHEHITIARITSDVIANKGEVIELSKDILDMLDISSTDEWPGSTYVPSSSDLLLRSTRRIQAIGSQLVTVINWFEPAALVDGTWESFYKDIMDAHFSYSLGVETGFRQEKEPLRGVPRHMMELTKLPFEFNYTIIRAPDNNLFLSDYQAYIPEIYTWSFNDFKAYVPKADTATFRDVVMSSVRIDLILHSYYTASKQRPDENTPKSMFLNILKERANTQNNKLTEFYRKLLNIMSAYNNFDPDRSEIDKLYEDRAKEWMKTGVRNRVSDLAPSLTARVNQVKGQNVPEDTDIVFDEDPINQDWAREGPGWVQGSGEMEEEDDNVVLGTLDDFDEHDGAYGNDGNDDD
jgi:hypothetical protein